tara:strand:- start:1017 stop:1289 length:273 start_codon:yes stop_codon:yes gene_type:complete
MDPLKTMVMTMNTEDIRKLWKYCADESNRRLEQKGEENKSALRVGDRVAFSAQSGQTTGTITKVKRVKAIVQGDDYLSWDVRLGALTKIA